MGVFMKVVQINTVYGTGSTGKITAAIYNLSQKEGFEAYVAYGRGNTPREYNINGKLIGNRIDFLSHVIYNFTTGQNGFASKSTTLKLLKWLDSINPDIIHLHNLHGFYVHIGLLFDYISNHNINVVWTLHDCWPFTGNCAFFDHIKCNKWQHGCYACDIYRSDYPYALFHDNSAINYELKKECFTKVNKMVIVTPSKWLSELVSLSFLNKYPVKIINNGIDLDVFKPTPFTNDYFHLNPNKTKILLGVASTWEPRKGLHYLLHLSEQFNSQNGYQVVIIGLSPKQCRQINKTYGTNVLAISRTNSQKELAEWYSAAYAYINPTLQDNFPTTNLEALACGTPVITFNTGGSPESLSPSSGIIVPQCDFEKLKDAVIALETAPISSSACIYQSKHYDQKSTFMEYIKLYRSFFD